MAEDLEHVILDEYNARVDLYESFAKKIEHLVEDILQGTGIQAHSVASRVKDRESLRGKLRKPGNRYRALGDITDIVGVRIITYFANDVDKLAKYIEQEFDVDRKNSTDRRTALDPDRFGYLSLHHVVSFRPDRARLLEYRQYTGLRAEIQTRSILQHAWAEIEHDLGYKTREAVPRDIRRRFSRIAGLLEIADQEFQSIRDELNEYERSVPEKIDKAPQMVDIDKVSFSVFISENPTVTELDSAIASFNNLAIIELKEKAAFAGLYTGFIERQIVKLKMLGVATIQDLEMKLRKHRAAILAFATKVLELERENGLVGDARQGISIYYLTKGISIYYLTYLLGGQTRNVEAVNKLISTDAGWLPESADNDREAQNLISIAEAVSDNQPF
jgi:putative GTP pyrophosphokinase